VKPAAALRDTFGFDRFLPGQEEIVHRALAGRDTLALMPTGSGKASLPARRRPPPLYLRDLAERLSDGRLDLERLRSLDDDAARAELMQVKGVGRFTADGVLMFALRRPDIWPAADLALRRAVERVWERRACVDRRHRRDRRRLSPLANARRPLSLSVRSPRGIELPHRAANHRGNDRVRWSRLPAEASDRVPGIPSRPA
jgi:hypothetical protein